MKLYLSALVCSIGLLVFVSMPQAQERPARENYHSPYSVKFTVPIRELLDDIEDTARGNPHNESSIPHAEWYSRRVRERYEAWGPPARHFPASREAEGKSIEWKRERIIAVGLRFQGYGYQHHHIPDWDPPSDWPWKEVAIGHNGKGVDCSNFTAFVYNQGLGYKPTGAIREQSERLEIPGPGEDRMHRAERIDLPQSYEERIKILHTGDLLYIRSLKGEVSHVVLWVGSIGKSPDNTPLILDSHGEGVKDAQGNPIPPGIHLRPFRENSWYNKSASHAHRILHTR